MAVLRYAETDDNTVNYIATLAFFCCVTCIIGMLKFGRFKTSFNVYSEKKRKSGKGQGDIGNVMSINGAYRTNRDEIFIYNNYSEPQRKLTPSVPVPPPIPFDSNPDSIKQSKSTSDLIKSKNLPPTQSGVSQDPRGAEHENSSSRNQDSKNYKQLDAEKRVAKQKIEEQKKLEKQRLEEKKKLEKQRIEEEKKRERLAMQERAKQEKLKKEREKEQLKKEKKTKKMAPQRPLHRLVVAESNNKAMKNTSEASQSKNKAVKNTSEESSGQKYSTNTLDSSISKTSGPPPYSEEPERSENPNNTNVFFSKPEDTGSWDMISQHRHNVCIKRPLKADAPMKGKATTLDMNFTIGEQTNTNNSEV